MASMSRMFQGGQGRGDYLCAGCVRRSKGAPASDSAPLRALLLYATTALADDEERAVRMTPLRIVVSAPPKKWGWGEPEVDLAEQQMAQPVFEKLEHQGQWRYNHQDSDQIWCTAAPFRGTPASE